MNTSVRMHGMLLAAVAVSAAAAQDGRPAPQPPVRASAVAIPENPVDHSRADYHGRRQGNGEKVVLNFNDRSVEDFIPWIVETTGKVVMPVNITTLRAKKITLINDQPIDRMGALDLLVESFRLNDVGVIEHEDRIIIALLTDMQRYDPPVLGPEVDISDWSIRGTLVTKIFAVENTDAGNIFDELQEIQLPDHASVSVEANSNQIIVTGHVGLCQRLGRIIEELDRNYIKIETRTFRLAYADASEVAQNIMDLFEDSGTTTTGGARAPARTQSRGRMTPAQRRAAAQQQASAADTVVGPSVELRITVNVQQNSVTVSGEPSIVDDIARLIDEEWDLERPEATKRVYHLQYTDPLKMAQMLGDLLGGGAGVVGGAGRRPGAPGQPGQRSDVSEVIGGIYQIQPYPDSNSLVVICKTEESFEFLDSLIADLDRPIFPGIPLVVELKHADAEEVADQVNAIFAPAGARVDIRRRDTGLGGIDMSGAEGGGGTTTGGREGPTGEVMSFPWQQGRTQEDQTPESPLIGKIRVVPIHRQNAVMILAAPEYRDAVRDIIVYDLDKSSRQVLISAIVAEVELTDELALGIRWSDIGIPTSNVDNRVSAGFSFAGARDDGILSGFFDTSTLDVTADVTLVLQALQQKTKVRILQEPAVFTADNQEAVFFEGQDVPVLQSSLTSTEGAAITNSVDYKQVGVGLNVRPRITNEGDVDMEINLEISNIDVAATAAAVSPVFDRRETTTQVIVRDGQTIVISGILRHLESKVRRKFPLLGDIPVVGALFTSVDNETTSTELLAFITPAVVNNPNDNDANFNEEARRKLENLSKPLKEQEVQEADPEKMRQRLFTQPGMPAFELPDDVGVENPEKKK